MNEWKWPINGPFAGSIQARTLPNIGSFTNYSPIQTRNSSKIEITKPNPMISTPSVPKSLWTIPVPNSDTSSKRLRINTPNENLVQINNGIVDTENNFNGELDPEIIPKIETIENWISRYSAACKREITAIALERQVQNQP
ncbi:unnamed protein product [Rhizophagus irregularis]|nr:unnamed protein product [Rhizophagus irregularis]